MAIQNYFNKGIIIQRQKQYDNYKRRYVSTGTTNAQIQRTQDVPDTEIYGVRGATHLAWVDISIDIKEGDRVVTTDGIVYSVIGVDLEGEDIAMNEHIKLSLKEFTS